MNTEIIVVGNSEDEIFYAFDDSLFLGDVTEEELRIHFEMIQKEDNMPEFDQFVLRALGRALNITISDGVTISVMNGKK